MTTADCRVYAALISDIKATYGEDDVGVVGETVPDSDVELLIASLSEVREKTIERRLQKAKSEYEEAANNGRNLEAVVVAEDALLRLASELAAKRNPELAERQLSGWREDLLAMNGVSPSLVESYLKRNLAGQRESLFSCVDEGPVLLVLPQNDPSVILRTRAAVQLRQRRFPGIAMVVSVSKIGYSEDGASALVWAKIDQNLEWGGEIVAVLEKSDGNWRVAMREDVGLY